MANLPFDATLHPPVPAAPAEGLFWDSAAKQLKPWEPRPVENLVAGPASVIAQVRKNELKPAVQQAALELPPGNAGRIARWLLDAALLPVREIAVVTTLGALAGLCGRAWTTPAPHTGLNINLILVARSATGKEMLHEGAGKLLAALRQKVPGVAHLINFDDYASGPALAKHCAVEPRCFVNFSSEFGRRLKRMANPKDAPMAELRTTVTKLYSKSGPSSFVGDLVYSKERHSIAGAVAFSIVGETTPGTLRSAMTQDMMEDGFLSRFGWVEYTGERPDENECVAAHSAPPAWLVDGLAPIAVQALTLLANNRPQEVAQDEAASDVLAGFKVRCNIGIKRADDNEAHRQIWSRAHLKAIKYASLLAVADNHTNPVATLAHAEWAIALVERDAALFENSLSSGDVGSDTAAQERKLVHILKEYLLSPPPTSYRVPAAMQRDGMVPRKYMQMRTSDVAAFKAHPLGSTKALEDAVRSLCDSGWLVEVDKNKAGETYGFQGRCYRIVDLPDAMTTSMPP
jgi:hypothetical protein